MTPQTALRTGMPMTLLPNAAVRILQMRKLLPPPES